MKKWYLLPFLFFELQVIIWAAEIKYPVSAIPVGLKNNARSVIRIDEQEFTLNSISNATLTVKKVITVLNDNGIDDATFALYYDKFQKISNINACVYDAYGAKISRIANDEIYDYAAISGFSLYEDSRVKIVEPGTKTTPFTIEIEYTKHFTGILNYPEWMPQEDYNISSESSVFTVISPTSIPVRFYERNLTQKSEITIADGKSKYQWKAENLAAVLPEKLSLSLNEYMPSVLTAPNNFEIGGVTGCASSWNAFGKWSDELITGTDNLPEERKIYFQNLVKEIENPYEKISTLYNWMQSATRYVSIQEGIGGYKPFPAETVDRLGYGDCKALANYMRTILQSVGINSFYTLVYAGNNQYRVLPQFPMNAFNHVFLCVPVNTDTLWLECTSQQASCGYLGDFTDDRDVLLITENGGKLVHTYAYSANENMVCRKASVQLDNLGNGKATIKTTYTGVACEAIYPILYSGDVDRKKLLLHNIDIPSFDLGTYKYAEKKDRIPEVYEDISLNLRNYGTKIGTNYLLTCNLMNRFEKSYRKGTSRLSDIRVMRSYTELDTIVYSSPEGFQLKDIPVNISIKTNYGEYTASFITTQNGVIYCRKLTVKKGNYPKEQFADIVKFYDDMVKADNSRMVLTGIEN